MSGRMVAIPGKGYRSRMATTIESTQGRARIVRSLIFGVIAFLSPTDG
jgi:hypothetical protein